jgi:RimJ/RimL family protein N-acetyltransferase
MIETITIRELSPADAEEFWTLRLKGLKEEPRAFTASYEEAAGESLAAVAKRLESSDNGFLLGSFDNGKLIGVTGFYRYHDGLKVKHKGVIWGVYLLPEYRGKGIARKLLLEVIEKCKKVPGIELLHLGVDPSNKAVVKLYESVGFTKWGTELHALKIGEQYVDEDQMVLWMPV